MNQRLGSRAAQAYGNEAHQSLTKHARMGGASGYICGRSLQASQISPPSVMTLCLYANPKPLAINMPSQLESEPLSMANLLFRRRFIDTAVPVGFPCHHLTILKDLGVVANAVPLLLSPLHSNDNITECISCKGKSHVEAVLTGTDCTHCENFSLTSISRETLSSQRVPLQLTPSHFLPPSDP